MRIDWEYVEYLLKEIGKINQADLYKCEIYKGGKRIIIDPQDLDDFRYMGLSNKDLFVFFRVVKGIAKFRVVEAESKNSLQLIIKNNKRKKK